jgi:hypothetical protein
VQPSKRRLYFEFATFRREISAPGSEVLKIKYLAAVAAQNDSRLRRQLVKRKSNL